ncbi:MAG: STAS domain-containing protein [bacterium]|nr:STAS domain-containing protein [bacterium]
MSDFTIELHEPAARNDMAVIRLTGTLDSYSLQELERSLGDLLQAGRHHLVINCQKLKFISSAGMGLFLGTLGEVEKKGGSLSFAQISQPEVHDAMNILGFFEVFKVFDQETQAVQDCHKS